jgi:hypothetical protein
MTTLRSLARLRAYALGTAQPIRTHRQLHVSKEPLVLAFVRMAGEPFSMWAALVGSRPGRAQWLYTPDPRNRDGQTDVFRDLAARLIEAGRSTLLRDDEPLQLWVSNAGAAADLRRLGRVMRIRDAGEDVAYAGALLDLYSESARAAGSALCVPTTEALAMHAVTGQSAFEDQNLASQLVWWTPDTLTRITGDPTADTGTVFERAARAEQLPMGTLTNPESDVHLERLVGRRAQLVRNLDATTTIDAEISALLRPEVERIWRAIWLAHALVSRLPEDRNAEDRWVDDARQYAAHQDYLDRGGKRRFTDSPMRAARLLSHWEGKQADAACHAVASDDLALLEAALDHRAVVGRVTNVETIKIGRATRPHITIVGPPTDMTADADVWLRSKPELKGSIVDVREGDGTAEVEVEITNGMRKHPLPAVGEQVAFVSLPWAFPLKPKVPREAPWTHRSPRSEALDDEA